jgi:hypothetical protein
LAIATLLAGCAEQAKQRSATRVYSVDFQGAAKLCKVPNNLSLAPGKPTQAEITVGNDGGWCAVTVAQSGGKPFDAGMVSTRPAHGKLLVHSVGDDTRIDYTPATGFTGSDAYAVRLVPGQAVLSVKVTVTPKA